MIEINKLLQPGINIIIFSELIDKDEFFKKALDEYKYIAISSINDFTDNMQDYKVLIINDTEMITKEFIHYSTKFENEIIIVPTTRQKPIDISSNTRPIKELENYDYKYTLIYCSRVIINIDDDGETIRIIKHPSLPPQTI